MIMMKTVTQSTSTSNEHRQEEWRDIPGFDGYQVSSLGRVRTFKQRGRSGNVRREPIKKKLTVVDNGRGRKYFEVGLSVDGKVYTKHVHVLVALAFIGMPNHDVVVIHDNHNTLDNRLENLHYADRKGRIQEKTLSAYRHGGGSRWNQFSQIDQLQRKILQEYIIRYLKEDIANRKLTLKDAARLVGMTESGMCRRMKGNRAQKKLMRLEQYLVRPSKD